MRDWDRFWWLILIVGLALCAGAVAAPYFLAHIMPPGAMYITNAEYWQLIGVLGLVVLIFLSSGLLLISWALRDRRLHLRRLAALHGDERAMPLAEIHPDPALARDLSEAPLELMWRVRVASRVFYVLTVAVRILFVIGFISLGAFMYVVATSRYSPPCRLHKSSSTARLRSP